MTTKSLQFTSGKIPAHMRTWGVVNLLLFVSILAIAYHSTPLLEEWTPSWNFLVLPVYLFVMWRLFRGVLMRSLHLDNHIFQLTLHPEDKIAEVWVYGKWFETEKFTLAFEDFAAVIHKSAEPRLVYQFPAIRHSIAKRGIHETIKEVINYYRHRGNTPYGSSSSLPEYLVSGYDPVSKKYTHDEATCNTRPTAISLAIGKNEGSFMMMPTYGWTQERLEEIAQHCAESGVEIVDKRPLFEKRMNLFI